MSNFNELAFIIERLRWLAYLEAWTAGYTAGGGDRNAGGIIQKAHADYETVKDTWGQAPEPDA